MLFLPIIFMTMAFAQEEEFAVETYCFQSVPIRIAEKKLQIILVPSDKMEQAKNCVTVHMRPHRRELLQNFARSIDPDLSVTFSSAEIKREPCLLKVEKIRSTKKSTTGIQANPTSFNATQEKFDETSKDEMQIQTLEAFSFSVAQDVIEGKCIYINKDLYEISINARRDVKPIVPPGTPPGTIVVVQTPPPDQKTISVTTALQLNRGTRVEIGSLVKEARKKESGISIAPIAQLENSAQQEEEKVFLSIR